MLAGAMGIAPLGERIFLVDVFIITISTGPLLELVWCHSSWGFRSMHCYCLLTVIHHYATNCPGSCIMLDSGGFVKFRPR
ncbi:hypothetical protein EJ04DRAFT_367986 [Polyplosphaeria fusca]|uniref:Uncharacterized protein n=1 Tax=Polyplosphaeria fusca TaxID=682080 RepID=A0A9P4V0Q0_9PLEO|nr:hypothetical protein EJ04DRAFT_367986 [Polyplosphaeria fusca]